MEQKEIISIDSTSGGNGDIWMRLVSFYSISVLKPHLKIQIKIPVFIADLADYTFGDRLVILSDNTVCDYTLTSLGIKHMIKDILKGRKFITPYARSVIKDKKKKEFKDHINLLMYNLMDHLGFIQVPKEKWIEVYQGYLDIIGLKKIRAISYESYVNQLHKDYPILFKKLNNEGLPTSTQLTIPADFNENIVVFPTGTSRQFIPVWWAKENIPDAYFAFFFKDKEAAIFINNGLKVVYFYKEAGDIIALSKAAKKTLSTDSFPSHLLQYATDNCVITITEVLKSRIISPVYKGQVVDNQVSCHPCLHIIKTLNCAAGYKECLNWKNAIYTQNIINMLCI